jgi:hypothetical protein
MASQVKKSIFVRRMEAKKKKGQLVRAKMHHAPSRINMLHPHVPVLHTHPSNLHPDASIPSPTFGQPPRKLSPRMSIVPGEEPFSRKRSNERLHEQDDHEGNVQGNEEDELDVAGGL